MYPIILALILAATLSAQNGMVSLPTTPAPQANQVFTADGAGGAAFATPVSVTPPAPGFLTTCPFHYTTGLSFEVDTCTANFGGLIVTASGIHTVTSAAADVTNPRVDLIYINSAGTIAILQGTAATPAAVPEIDAATQVEITHYTILANASTPAVSVVTIYDENTEWTSAVTAHFNAASTNNPYHLTHDIEATAAVLTNNFTLTKPAAGTVDLANYNFLSCYVRSKAVWPTGGGTGANGALNLTFQWLNGATLKGFGTVLRTGAFGFDSSITSVYQIVQISTSLFGINGIPVTTLRGQITGTGSGSIGFYVDWCELQSGVSPTPLPANLMTTNGTWNSTAFYPTNAVVTNAAGVGFLALLPNTNVALSNTTTWQSLGNIAGGFGASFGDCSGSTTLTANVTAYIPRIPYACTIVGESITALASGGGAAGTVTFKTLRAATGGTAVASASINTSGISISSGTLLQSFTVSDFTSTAIAKADTLAIQLTAVGTAVCASVYVDCDKIP